MFPYEKNFEISSGVFVSYQEIIREIGVLVTDERRKRIDDVVEGRNFSIAVVLENLYDRGNGSAVMRTAEAFGYQKFEIIEMSEKFKVANRVASGAEKWLHRRHWKSTTSCIQQLKKEGYRICVTSLEASKPIQDVDWTIPTALVLGNEKDGVSPEMLEQSDLRVIIPMSGFVQSFNISVAGALSLYHIAEYRKTKLGKHADVSDEQKQILKALYYLKTLDSAPEILLSRRKV
jgi:tRNA (guanosine-2'-O-)-methyltransferase